MVRGYEGWALDQALIVDASTPGFFAASCRWGAARRQAAYLVLARLNDGDVTVLARHLDGALLERGIAVDAGSEPRVIVGRALLALRPRRVLRAALGGFLPPGLIGTLTKLGFYPLEISGSYAEIVHFFASGDDDVRARVRVLTQHRGPLIIGQIRALAGLEPDLVHRAVVPHIRDPESARTFADAVAYLRRCCSGATPEALRASLDAWPVDRDIKHWVRRWADRFDRPPGLHDLARALAGRPGIKLLATGADLVAAERRYRWGLYDMVPEVLVGRHAYVEYRPTVPGGRVLVAVLRWSEHGYVLDRIHRPDHHLGHDPGHAVLQQHLRGAGVIVKSRVPVGPRMHAAMRAWFGIYPRDLNEVDDPDTRPFDAEGDA
ncbi:hypothetical protein [Methylobacterium sp. B1]|uniref:hypothetical protein n=1 Tax=Methylobacterium sp. B1 TaxID=91459 RepID=UPI0005B8366B|nr:hypothetical protein [Methylobacterium sp. B1]